VPFAIELMLLEKIKIRVSLVITSAVKAFEGVRI